MSTDPEILEIPVTPRPESLVSSILQALGWVVLIPFLLAGMLAMDRGQPDEYGCIFFMAALVSTVLAIIVVFTFVRQSRLPPSSSALQIEPDQIRWQFAEGGEVVVPYGEIWVAQKEGRGRKERLVLKSLEKVWIDIQTAFFPEAHVADSILEAVYDRIGHLPGGRQKLDGIAARRAVAERVNSGRRTVVLTTSVILGLVFLAQLATGVLADPLAELVTGVPADPFRLWAFGANSYPLVREGELFRLATANVLHANLLHVLFNIMVLVSFGSFLEPLLGTGRFLSVFLISSLAGAAGSAFLGHHALALGASTGIAGLIAAYALILWRWPDRLSNPPTKGTWLWLAFAFVWPALTFQNVDHMAHLTGFLAGLAVVFPETRKADLAELADRHRALFRGIAALLVALFLVAGGIAVRRAREPQRDLKVATTLLRDTSVPSAVLNNLAWTVATTRSASPDQLTTALQGIERAVASDPGTAELRDTRATVLYRLGRWEEAVRTEYDLLAASRTPFHLSQLARFEWALVKERGPLFLGEPTKVLPRARIVPGAIFVEVSDPHLLSGAILHLVLAREAKVSALLELTMGASEASGILRYDFPRDLAFPRPDKALLTLVDTRKTGEPPSETRWEFQPIVPEAARLP